MIEGFRKSVGKESLAPKNLNSSAARDRGEELLSAIENIDRRLDEDVAKRFGVGFYDKARARINGWYEQFFQKVENGVDWGQSVGVIPKSKVGMRFASGAFGVATAILPGGLLLLPLVHILRKRSYKKDTSNSDIEI